MTKKVHLKLIGNPSHLHFSLGIASALDEERSPQRRRSGVRMKSFRPFHVYAVLFSYFLLTSDSYWWHTVSAKICNRQTALVRIDYERSFHFDLDFKSDRKLKPPTSVTRMTIIKHLKIKIDFINPFYTIIKY